MRLTRGNTVTFSKNIKDSVGVEPLNSVPVTARILDPGQTVITQGPAFKNLETGLYDFSFVVAANAPFSTVEHSWTIDWSFQNGSQILNVITEFDVVEDDGELPPRTLILSTKSKETIEFLLPDRAQSLVFEIINYKDEVVYTTTNISDFETTSTTKGYIYGLPFDTSILSNGDYIVRVHAKIPNFRQTYVEIVIARIVPNYFWFYVPQLQMYLDKVRKPGQLVQSYGISDLYEYLTKGMSMLNLVPPQITNWSFTNFPGSPNNGSSFDISSYIVAAAACWGLQAQIVMYGELGFSFSGQSIGLEYDPGGAISGTIETLLNRINTEFPKSKELMLRQMQHVAWVGVRRQFYNQNMSRIDITQRAFSMQLNMLNTKMAYRYLV